MVTAAHVYLLLTLTVVGAPHNALEFLSLAGSLGLCISGYIALFRPRVGAKLALPSAIICWSFYGPAILATLAAERQRQITDPRIAVLPYFAVSVLVGVTVYAAIVSFRPANERTGGNWIFPERAAKSTRTVACLGSLAFVAVLVAWLGFGQTRSVHRASRFLIPGGYVGWVKVEFGVAGVPPLPVDGGNYKFEIPASGVFQTSSAEQFGPNTDEYYYVSGSELQHLPSTGSTGRMIWARMNGEAGTVTSPQRYEQFFVGTEQQFKQQAGEPGTKSSAAVAK